MDTWSFFHTCLVSIWLHRFYIYSAIAFGISLWIVIQFTTTRTKRKGEKSHGNPSSPEGTADKLGNGSAPPQAQEVHVAGVKIFYGSQTGTAKRFAQALAEAVTSLNLPVEVINMGDYDPEDGLSEETSSRNICVFLVATYTDGQPPESAAWFSWFCQWLEEAANDFRVGKSFLQGLRYAVFGLGNSAYVDHYNTVGRRMDRWLWMLSASRIMTRAEGDCNVAQSKHGSIEADFEAWKGKFLSRLQALCRGEKKPCSGKCKKGKCKSSGKQSKESSDNEHRTSEHENTEAEELFETSSEEEAGGTDSVIDVEDLGNIMGHMKKAKREQELQEGAAGAGSKEEAERREMITPALREALTKQGDAAWPWGLLQAHLLWHESHRCMEATPSLACANKCVFCWRHHTNPVGTEWRWRTDPPEVILQEAMEKHQSMIRQLKGVAGVKAARLEEALAVKHCALSLVGEPIMYPHINSLVRLLHQHGISTFLVTNAQFPEEIRRLEPVTQLYVSVDASTKESLRRIDRPLFKDFWQRFLDSLKALAEKQQRTVYRLTLVKAWNVDEVKAYADLISIGKPDFIEVKGVTYCGESSASSLTLANVPWHGEVLSFAQELARLLPEYGVACEHQHSNCLLLAHSKFQVDGQWRTWIDYGRFQELVREREQSGGSRSFSAAEYTARTPAWALFGARERGFDPLHVRVPRRSKARLASGC
ncbi:PREDICTED: LOW QUALITY PROTEIN: S-adenosyl-L-methionine-dependent tRNA 4-demethylwyosine synthase [Ficedula albicollis]|uniref:LOW QUALITY PROTEIN: S-adenosyl-L-methionine-dependent tRNA 4-demethylwyosine synthase n=1 Tax=Ficedula albicollis TaxID=59894 RepID=UPI0007AD8DC2|nr:PREDICTED: LOW QUALITY PROTEIN: S-adenosyl-L-methionine-dependent tRNA 4-demethylwyosine synthase [Ficedula albicollis]